MLPRGSQLVVASHNEGKVREIKALLGPHGIEPISAGALGLPEPEETGATFAANAEIKAHASAKASHHAALADDSGLCVDALDGAPGIYSARWAGPTKDFRIAMTRIHDELRHKGLTDQRGQIRLRALHRAAVRRSAGVRRRSAWPSHLSAARRSTASAMIPSSSPTAWTRPLREIDPAQKHAMSHRAKAFEKLLHSAAFLRRVS